ncbi:hypothetical protein Dimus_029885 [Dionaea muscipula]
MAVRGSTTVWPYQFLLASSPKSCITRVSSCNNSIILDFSNTNYKTIAQRNQHVADHISSECISTVTSAAAFKKARIRLSSTPFPKTNTTSSLLETIGSFRLKLKAIACYCGVCQIYD